MWLLFGDESHGEERCHGEDREGSKEKVVIENSLFLVPCILIHGEGREQAEGDVRT